MTYIFLFVMMIEIDGHQALGLLGQFDSAESCQSAYKELERKGQDMKTIGCMQVVKQDKNGAAI